MLGDQIRVLDLLPSPDGDEGSPVKCNIRVVSLASRPRYTTLSYVWGHQSTGDEYIELNGVRSPVSQSIYAALRRLRLRDTVRTLWIDQLCINQENLLEKAAQVRLMRQIYANCSDCVAWLGEVRDDIPMEDARAALEFIEYLAKTADAGDLSETVPAPAFMASLETFEGPIRALRSISVNEHPWWHRIWTVQEAVLPPKLCLVQGELLLPWDRVIQASHAWTTNMPESLSSLVTTHHNLTTIGDFMAHVVWVHASSDGDGAPLDLMVRWRMREATNPLDKVYALLGLLSQGELPSVEHCDYGVRESEVYASTTVDLILREASLRPLIADPRLEHPTEGLPTWAIDMSGAPPVEMYYPLNGYFGYDAAKGRRLDVRALRKAIQKPVEVLPLRGSHVNKVQRVARAQFASGNDTSDENLVQVLRLWAQEASVDLHVGEQADESSVALSRAMSPSEVFGQTLIGDLRRNHEDWFLCRAMPDDIHEVLGFLRDGKSISPGIRRTLWRMVKDAAFFVTENGAMGLGHRDTVAGDEVWIFHGGRMPFIIRPRDDNNHVDFGFVGRCYLQGVMFGELFKHRKTRPPTRDIRLH